MIDRDDVACSIKVGGLEGHSATVWGFDSVGTWGGKRAMVAHFGEGNDKKVLMYILVGSFGRVGKWRWNPGPSRWQVAKLLTWALQTGVDPERLYDAITDVIAGEE